MRPRYANAPRAERAITLSKMHAGRIAVYASLGAASAGAMSLVVGPSATASQFMILNWVAAAVVMWVGLAMAGVMPRLALVDPLARAQAVLSQHSAAASRYGAASPWVAGLVWGLTPCPLVYAAAVSASMMGSAAEGALFMAAYGAGTLPSVTATALGLTGLKALRANSLAHRSAGLAVAAFGLFAALSGLPTAAICAVR